MRPIPEAIREAVESALDVHGATDPRIASALPVAGGCIHNGSRIETVSGSVHFLKWNADAPAGMFTAEVDGLRALRRAAEETAAGLRVPAPLAWEDGSPGWLLMEYVEPGAGGPYSAARLGGGLARLHAAGAELPPGWVTDNWIGSLPQHNTPCDDWPSFWRDRRLAPQLQLARRRGRLGDDVFDRLLDTVPQALEGATADALLHGDLWSGNTFTDGHGVPVLIDPAVYVGDGEADLAMTELFGGFGRGFYEAYGEVRPVSPAYRSHRRDLYQLYYLLVHVNLFGGSYAASSRSAAQSVLAALGG